MKSRIRGKENEVIMIKKKEKVKVKRRSKIDKKSIEEMIYYLFYLTEQK